MNNKNVLDKFETIYVLGAEGFIGSKISELLNESHTVIKLGRSDLNFIEPLTYNKFKFENAAIIDCIAKIDGNKNEIEETNENGFKNFIQHLSSVKFNGLYIYFSTISTINPHI